MNADFLQDSKWIYWHKISVDASRVWYDGIFPSIECEGNIYMLMLESIRAKKKIEKSYNGE